MVQNKKIKTTYLIVVAFLCVLGVLGAFQAIYQFWPLVKSLGPQIASLPPPSPIDCYTEKWLIIFCSCFGVGDLDRGWESVHTLATVVVVVVWVVVVAVDGWPSGALKGCVLKCYPIDKKITVKHEDISIWGECWTTRQTKHFEECFPGIFQGA